VTRLEIREVPQSAGQRVLHQVLRVAELARIGRQPAASPATQRWHDPLEQQVNRTRIALSYTHEQVDRGSPVSFDILQDVNQRAWRCRPRRKRLHNHTAPTACARDAVQTEICVAQAVFEIIDSSAAPPEMTTTKCRDSDRLDPTR
jgi:hypothetical protein